MRVVAFVVVALCAVFSLRCSAEKAVDIDYFVERMDCHNAPFGLRLPATFQELLAMSPVLSRQIYNVTHVEGLDYTYLEEVVYFKGLTLDVTTFSNDPKRYMIATAEIRDPAWSHISPFHIGQNAATVHALFGGIGNASLALRADYFGEAGSGIYFESQADRVTAVKYHCYTG